MPTLTVLLLLMSGASGPDPKVLSPVEAKALESLAGGAYRVDATQAFTVTLGGLGRVQVGFACAVEETPRCKLVVARESRAVQVLDDPLAVSSGSWACEPAALSFTDVNGDGQVDLAVIFTCMTGIGPTGAHEFPAGEVFLLRDGLLTTDARIDQAVEAARPKTVKALVAVARRATQPPRPADQRPAPPVGRPAGAR